MRQRGVAGVMTVSVIDRLEMIDVDDQKRACPCLRSNSVEKESAIERAGQGVVAQQILDALHSGIPARAQSRKNDPGQGDGQHQADCGGNDSQGSGHARQRTMCDSPKHPEIDERLQAKSDRHRYQQWSVTFSELVACSHRIRLKLLSDHYAPRNLWAGYRVRLISRTRL